MDVHRGMVDITPVALNEAHQADLATQGNEGVDFRHAWAGPGVRYVVLLVGRSQRLGGEAHSRARRSSDNEASEVPVQA
jgi:hypothetical protein